MREGSILKISGALTILLSLVFLNMVPVYLGKSILAGFCILGVALINIFLFISLRLGYSLITASVSGASALTSILLREFHGVEFAGVTLSWRAIALVYFLIFITAIYCSKEEEIKKIKYIIYPLLGAILMIGAVIIYGSITFQVPPDATRGISAVTKEKTWRAMGILLGVLNLGIVHSIIKGRYIAYILLMSFIVAPLITVPLTIKAVTFGIFSQILFLVQIYTAGLITSWYMGLKKL
ncbi:hypothetical protein E3E31_09115 [Thermococcus sp. M39]|uniref:hypothetical protein n=1 Tax=unclassified Thermococcus TaxID=2627626 RepID=UPI00143A60B5|nr:MULTISPECIES: hypothetical protein [unclassified Thermococcus]NJE08676.1 hypothetical protein [Thermococcus sp. M39]NJE13023.1 hypothetical protein [Thermococcus sp. LS2]